MTTGTALSTITEPAHRAVAGLGAGGVNAIVPQTFDDVYRFSQVLAKSGLCPHGMDTPEKVSVAILTGLEIGVKPMQAVQGIAVIGGRPCIWGDLALGIVRGAGTLEYIKESFEGDEAVCDWTAANPSGTMLRFKAVCRVKRKGEPEVVTEFSIGDAVVAKLWGKRGYNGKDTPWITNPKRMLKMRARGFGLRDTHADVLKGLYIAEEMIGVEEDRVAIAGPSAPPPVPPPPAEQEEERPSLKPNAPANANAGPAAPPAEEVEEAEIVEGPSPAQEGGTEAVEPTQEEIFDPEAWLDEARDRFAEARTEADVDAVHETFGDTAVELLSLTDRQKYVDLHETAIQRVEVKGQPEQAEITGKPGPAPIEDDEDDFPGNDHIVEKEATPLTPGEAYLARIREAVADPVRTLESLSGLWSATKADRQQLVADGHLTREQVKILTAEVKARWPAPAEQPASPPAGPEAPPADEDPAVTYDRTFRQRLEACASELDVNALVPATLAERNKFSGHPLHKTWTEAVKQRRKQLSGIA